MALEPITAKGILDKDHGQTDEHGVCDAHKSIAGQTIATEDETANDGLQQVVGETHAAKETKMAESTANGVEGVPCRNHRRCDHREDEEVVDGSEPQGPIPKILQAQHDDDNGRYAKNAMPYLQVPSLIVKETMSPQLHAEDEKAEQLGESPAEDIESQIEFEPVSEVVDGILHERTVLMQADGPVVYLKERGMVYRGARKQAEQLHRLDGQQCDDAPHGS